MTESDLDQMADDIFEQSRPKKRINDLRDVPKYKKDEYVGDDDFDIVYRTPSNLNIDDLLPKKYEELSEKIEKRLNEIKQKKNNKK